MAGWPKPIKGKAIIPDTVGWTFILCTHIGGFGWPVPRAYKYDSAVAKVTEGGLRVPAPRFSGPHPAAQTKSRIRQRLARVTEGGLWALSLRFSGLLPHKKKGSCTTAPCQGSLKEVFGSSPTVLGSAPSSATPVPCQGH